MNTDKSARQSGSLAKYSAAEREQLVREQAQSGLSKREFCEQKGINLTTFYGWTQSKRRARKKPAFARVEVAGSATTSVEVQLPNGTRVGISHQGKREDLVALVRGLAGC